MRLRRAASGNRFAATIWPGFVDAMTALLLVLMFVLTIFMIVQSVLREQVSDQETRIADQATQLSAQETRLAELGDRVADLGAALTTSQQQSAALEQDLTAQTDHADQLQDAAEQARAEARQRAANIARLSAQLDASRANLANATTDLDQARSRLTDFEAEVAALMAARAADQQQAESDRQALTAQLDEQQRRASAAELAVAAARAEVDAQAEQARLAAARRDALQELIADLRRQNAGATGTQTQLEQQLSDAEAARLTEAAAAEALRKRLAESDTELTAMTLSLEQARREAEETLTKLAAAEAARAELSQQAETNLTDARRDAALLATAQAALARQEQLSSESQRRVALLNEQVASLSAELGRLQSLLDTAGDTQQQAELRVADLGQQLNAALLLAAEEKDRRLVLEEEARAKAEAEARDLARYRSEFFGRLSQILAGRQGVQVVGDRFVFDSNVLFQPGEATLSDAGRDQIRSVADLLQSVATEIPPEIDWIIRVDGHTDSTPLSGAGRYRDNWELSQARALAVVRFMTGDLGFPANRLAATGFADTRPVATGDDARSRAQNRRIELKLTER